MSSDSLAALLVVAVQLMTPLLWGVLGEVLSERAGVLNVGLEGSILLGAWGTAVGLSHTDNLLVGLGTGILVGLVTGAVLSVLYIWRGVDQIVGGVMVNLFALGFTTAMWVALQGDRAGHNAPRVAIPGLSSLPVIGPALFRQNLFVYAGLIAVPVIALLLARTRWGLRLRAAGEAPAALDAAGVSVVRVRAGGLIAGTVLAAVGGSALVLTSSSGGFVTNMSAGLGFIALGVVILARWSPLLSLLVAVVFGLLQALQYQAQAIPALNSMPMEVLLALPYVIAIVVVAVARGTRYPAAVGVPWRVGV